LNVSVLMPVRNDARSVAATMESLFAQTRLPDEIVVADGCSTDGTVEQMLSFADRGVPIRVVRNESLFAGGGRNAATRAASHDLLVVMDLGNRAHPKWLESMVAPFEEDPSLDYLGGVFYPLIGTWYERVSAAIIYFEDSLGLTWTHEELKRNARVGLPGGLCMAYRRSIWERAGGFSEWARKGQDRLFSLRVRRIGGRIGMSLDAVIYHHMAASTREAFDKHFHYAVWSGRTALPRRRFVRLARTYAAGAAVAGAALFVTWVAWLMPFLVAAYVYVGAWRKLDILARATGNPFSARQRFWAVVLLFVKDAAVLSGNILGSLDRLARPRWRRLTREYLEEGRQPPTLQKTSAVDSLARTGTR
jgi:glycosyltransferase involved in cell wall biosynthesis